MTETILSVVFVVLLLACVDPLHLWMPNSLQTAGLVGLILAAVIYAGLLFRERPRDEREALHLARSSRGGYLTGIIGFTAFIVVEMLAGRKLNKAVVAILAAMVVVKLVAPSLLRAARPQPPTSVRQRPAGVQPLTTSAATRPSAPGVPALRDCDKITLTFG